MLNRKGQALVEFIIILPLFLMILFAVVDFGFIFSNKNELENISIDVVDMVRNDININDIKSKYPKVNIDIKKEDKFTNVIISKGININTPGLNLVLGNPYLVKIERVIYNE